MIVSWDVAFVESLSTYGRDPFQAISGSFVKDTPKYGGHSVIMHSESSYPASWILFLRLSLFRMRKLRP